MGTAKVKSPVDLEEDTVELAWSAAKKAFHTGRQGAPVILGMISKIAGSHSASNALFALGVVNVLTLYVNFWMGIGGAYAAVREEAQVEGTLMGFSYGFGHQLAGSYSADALELRHSTHKLPGRSHREAAEIFKREHNSGLAKGWLQAAHLKHDHKRVMIQQLNEEAAESKAVRRSWSPGDKYAILIYHGLKRLQDS